MKKSNPRPQTVQKYLAILNEIAKHDTMRRKHMRDVFKKHKATHMLDAAMLKLGYISNNGRGNGYVINLKEPQPVHARRVVSVVNTKKYTLNNKHEDIDIQVLDSSPLTIEHVNKRVDVMLEHHIRLYHQNKLGLWWNKNKKAVVILVIALASFAVGFLI